MAILHWLFIFYVLFTDFAIAVLHGPLADPVVQHYWPNAQGAFAHFAVQFSLLIGFLQQYLWFLQLLPAFGMVSAANKRKYPLPRNIKYKDMLRWLAGLEQGRKPKCPYTVKQFQYIDEVDNFDVMEWVYKPLRDEIYNKTEQFDNLRLFALVVDDDIVALWWLVNHDSLAPSIQKFIRLF